MSNALSNKSRSVPLRTASPQAGGIRSWLGEAAQTILGQTQLSAARQDVLRRAIVSAVIIGVLPIQQMRIPGWPAVLVACIVALAYNMPLGYLVFVKERAFLARSLSLLLDMVVLMGASLYVFQEMGAANSASDIWLVFVVYIVIGGFTLGPIGSLMYTTLWVTWLALGTLLFFSGESQYQTELPIRLVFLSLIGFVALGMASELQKRRGRLEQQNRQTMEMLATLVEARDTDAGAHLHSIQYFSRALARHLGLSEREAQELADASMMHDVGKAHVPDAILKKPGPLDPEEWRLMRRHPAWGEHLLIENDDFELARQVARWHHEHWDGNGYPDGLAGEQIPFAVRIVAVADVYDALISKRPYKEAWPPESALAELQRIGGSHLDPRVVRAFVELWEQGVIASIGQQIGGLAATGDTGMERAA